jgi:phosphoribosylformimino-5-aminoimidazole carboxamide ribotide isomerase
MLVIPAIDILGGRCVRLKQGDFEHEKVYDEDPLSVARSFFEQGASWLHIVDLDGAREGSPVNLDVVRSICEKVPVSVQLGGGVRNSSHMARVMTAGVKRVVVGSALLGDPKATRSLITDYARNLVGGIDARDGKVAIQGWTQTTQTDAIELARLVEGLGMVRLVVTDIQTDGMLEGPNFDFVQRLSENVQVPIIASGGVSSLEDLRRLSEIPGVEAAIVGKALYEGSFKLGDAMSAVAAV